jgi:methylmalonyl-CoA mutase C-terminal domain/subunit
LVIGHLLSKRGAMTNDRPIRVLVAKAGLDGHDRGAKIVAASLRDAGMEVIYTGLRQTPEMIVHAAVQEDVDAIGLSSLSGAHMSLFPRVLELLAEQNASAILLFGGGVIPEKEAAQLTAAGVGRLFGPGTDTREIAEYLRQEVKSRRATQEA